METKKPTVYKKVYAKDVIDYENTKMTYIGRGGPGEEDFFSKFCSNKKGMAHLAGDVRGALVRYDEASAK